MGFGLVNRFTGYSQVVTTSNYNTLEIALTIAHKVFDVCLLGNTMKLEESVASRILILDSISRPKLASRGPEMEHQAQWFIPLLFAVAMKTYVNVWASC
jgi:hypothetical protein